MDSMMFIHADENRDEINALLEIEQADIEINIEAGSAYIDNTWSITIPESVWEQHPIQEGHYVYIPGTEWGGMATLVVHSTESRSVTVQGPTFRGILHQKALIPPAGEGYLVITDVDANELIRQAVGGRFGSLVHVTDDVYGKTVSASWRYQTVATGLQTVLRDADLRLNVTYDNQRKSIVLSAGRVNDLSDQVDISQDYGVDFTSSSGNVETYNHCLALGQGELAERMVVNVYRYNGAYYTAMPSGMTEKDVRTIVLDYPNAETESDLIKSAVDRLKAYAPESSVSIDEINLVDVEAELGDLLGVRDRLTGMSAQSAITRKILTIQAGVLTITTKVG